jgi:hypothetical protein
VDAVELKGEGLVCLDLLFVHWRPIWFLNPYPVVDATSYYVTLLWPHFKNRGNVWRCWRKPV